MNKSGIAPNVISHPKGGGAIGGIGESFSPDLHTGTGNLTIPIGLPPGRNGFAPEVSLSYSTGQGNGPFGLGWRLSTPGVTRDTTDGVPTYDDDVDVFLLSGMERLVRVGANRYRPRTEGSFARIERRDDVWEVRTRSGLVSRYSATVRNPDDDQQIFAWYLTETLDTFGNRIEYEYERDEVREHESHRWDQLRLARIRYVDHGPRDDPRFLVTVDFIYEDRPDPFSSYRSGFEIRTVRRCARIEVRTHADETRLARIYHFQYLDRGASLLQRLVVEGVNGDERETLPPLELGYTEFRPEERLYQPVAGTLPDRSLAHPDFDLADVFGSGLPDIVQLGDEYRYWKNLGNGRFDLPRTFEGLPGARLGDRGVMLADANGDGHIDLLLSQPAGYMPLVAEGPREPFIAYPAGPSFSLEDPEIRLIDLDGDGVTDALRTGAAFELFYHDADAGWRAAEVRERDQLDRFPNVYFSDPRVKLADMTGDGLTDIVFVDGERIDYWPYLGRGRWAARVTMRGQLAFPDSQIFGGIGFEPKRLMLGDVDGDGLADLVYVESGRITVWLNCCGNRWSEPIVIHGTPPISDADAVRLVDLNGTGTAGILWSYDAGTFADSSYKFLDLTGGVKPYLLNQRDNHAGARTRIEYTPSTRFYLDDEASPETRWRSRLPFPVQVVSRVETIDELSRGKLTTEYRYHQGYWDGEEREFRGFALVEQLDTETFERYHLSGNAEFESVERARFSPPTLTRTWFHQGEVVDASGVRTEPELFGVLGDTSVFSPRDRAELNAIAAAAAQAAEPERVRDALRALRGSILRTELFALDGSPLQHRPYTVTESLHDVREIEHGELGVYLPFHIGTRTTDWERGTEPMHRFSFTGEHDNYGQPRSMLDIAVPRGRDPFATLSSAAESYLATFAVTQYAQRDDDIYIVDRVARSSQYEVREDGVSSVFALRAAVSARTADLRLIGHARTFFDGDAFVGLPLGQLGNYGVPVRAEVLAIDAEFLQATSAPSYLDPTNPSVGAMYPVEFRDALLPLAGYVYYGTNEVPGSPAGYYVATDRGRYDFQSGEIARGAIRETRDALGHATNVELDEYELLPTGVTDAAGLVTSATHDYRILSPHIITDANGNTSEAVYSPASLLQAQFVRGKNGEGDTTHPSVRFEYDLHAFAARGEPMSVRTIRRVHHDSEADVDAGSRDATLETVEYSDGFGRLLQTRAQAEDTIYGDDTFGDSGLPGDASAPNRPAVAHTAPDHVIVSGWQVYDNKGRIIEKYEPFFARGWAYRAPEDSQRGQKASMFYDARGRLARTVKPDGSETLVVFGIPTDLATPAAFSPTAWELFTYDANDNAGRTHEATSGSYQSHWNTPSSVVVDALGRTTTAIARNGTELITTHSRYDIQGNLLSLIDALGREAFRYSYDLLGRRWRADSIDAGRRDTVFDALGQPIEGRDAKGSLVVQGFDALRRPTRTWARDSAASPLQLRTVLSYGDEGTAAERDAARSRNALGRLAAQHDGAGLVRVNAYDFKGNVLEKSRRVIADGPLLAAYANAATNGWQVTAFSPDWQPASGETLADVEARLLEAQPYETTSSFDALGRAKLVRLPQDVEDRRREVRPFYNRAGALERISLDDDVYVDRIAYDANGRRVLIAYGNGTMTRYAYDPHTFRLARMRSERFTSSNATTYVPAAGTLQDCTYAYDLAGNILSITDRAPAAGIPDNPDAALADDPALAQLLAAGDALVRQFSYDPIYRLRSATGRECDQPVGNPPWLDEPRCVDLTRTRAYTEQYSYDSAGSMLSLAHQNATGGFVRTFEVGIDSNRLRALRLDATTSLEYQHDGNGNTLAESSSRHFDWNYADQLKAFATQTIGAEPSVHAQYLYDAAGQRVKKLVRKQGGRVEVTHYIDGTFEHHRWATGENNHIHVTDAARRIALVRVGPAQSDDTSPAVRFELGDHLGSSSVVVDAAGSLFNREEFTPYGDTSFGSYAKKRYRFTGMERDEESALSHHGLRYYSPWLSRWINCDPAGPVDGHNLFSYAVNSPVANVDASGTQAVKIAPPAPAPPPQNTLLTGTPANDNIPSSQPATTAAREALPASTPELVRSTAAYLSAVLPAVAMGMETWLYTQRTGSIVDFGNPLGVPREDMGFAILRQTRPIQFGQPPLAPIPVAPPIPDSPPSPRTTPDQRRSKPLERVNLDTSTIVAATSLRSPFLVIGLNIFLLDKEKVATQAALTEFVDVSWKHAGPIEKLAAAMFLLGVREIPNDPAPEVMNIKITSKTSQKRLGRIDKIIFGTGHKLGIRTITGDGRFARSAASRGVHIKIYEHPPGRYRGI